MWWLHTNLFAVRDAYRKPQFHHRGSKQNFLANDFSRIRISCFRYFIITFFYHHLLEYWLLPNRIWSTLQVFHQPQEAFMNNSGKSSAHHNSPNRLKLPFAVFVYGGGDINHFTLHRTSIQIALCVSLSRLFPCPQLVKSRQDSSYSRRGLPTYLPITSFPPWTIKRSSSHRKPKPQPRSNQGYEMRWMRAYLLHYFFHLHSSMH